MNTTRQFRWIDWLSLAGLAAAVYVVYELVRRASWPSMSTLDVSTIAAAIFIGVLSLVLSGMSLAAIVAGTRRSGGVSIVPAVIAANRTVLTKYLPGKIWYVLGISESLVADGLRRRNAWGAVLLYQVILIGSALLLGIAGSGDLLGRQPVFQFDMEGGPWIVFLLVLAIGVCLVAGAARFYRQGGMAAFPNVHAGWICASGAVALLHWILQGISIWLILSTVHGAWLPTSTILIVPGIYALGFLVLIAPGGMGVRELLFVQYFLDLGLSTEIAATLAIFARIGSLAIELCMWSLLHVRPLRSASQNSSLD